MYSERVGRLRSSAIRDILRIASRPGMISFAGGMPSAELFPLKEIDKAAQAVLSKNGAAALQYSFTEGLPELREKIAKKLVPCSDVLGPENILITHGSQQGLDLISKLYIDNGDTVFTENPTYLGALQPFNFFQADIKAMPYDDNGISIERLNEELKRQRPKFIYLMPNYQNPTGNSLTGERRLKLIEIIKDQGLLLIEDDPYSNLSFNSERPPSLFALGKTKHVIYLSTFSKTIAPGFRVAYVAADEEIISKLAVIKQGTDLQTNTFGQRVINEYLDSVDYGAHISLLQNTYRQRRDCMLSAMKRYFPESVIWNCPGGGMFVWVTLPGGLDAKKVLAQCIAENVAFVPGQEFFPGGSGKNTMRLNFSNAKPENIEEGIKRIGEVLKKSL